jgi:hypothetical protein
LTWSLQWAGREAFYETLARRGKIKPEDVRPEFCDGDHVMLNLFFELSTARQIGMGVGPIPIGTFWEAQKRHRLPDAAVTLLQRCDIEFMRVTSASRATT